MTTVFEFVTVSTSVLRYIAANGITPDDITDAGYYREYRRLRATLDREAAARVAAKRNCIETARMMEIVSHMESQINEPNAS